MDASISNVNRGGPARAAWFLLLLLVAALFLAQNNLPFILRMPDTSFMWSGKPAWPTELQDYTYSGEAGNQTSRLVGLALLALFVLAGTVAYRARGIVIQPLVAIPLLLSFYWTLLSLIWADDSGLTLRRLLVFGVFWAAAFTAARILSFDQLLRCCYWATLTFAVAGLLAEIIRGRFAPFAPVAEYWYLGEMHPTMQPQVCTLLVLSAVALVRRHTAGLAPLGYALSAALGVGLLYLHRSRTYLGVAVIAAVLLFLLTQERRRRLRLIVAGSILAVAAMILFLSFWEKETLLLAQNLFLLGREPGSTEHLSGRVELWNICLQFLSERPLAGYGYGSFVGTAKTIEFKSALGWLAPTPHNTLLELALDGGLVGLVLGVTTLGASLSVALSRYRKYRETAVAFGSALIVAYLMAMPFTSFTSSTTILPFVLMVIQCKLAFAIDLYPCTSPTIAAAPARLDRSSRRSGFENAAPTRS